MSTAVQHMPGALPLLLYYIGSTNPQYREMPNLGNLDDNLNQAWHLYRVPAATRPHVHQVILETQTQRQAGRVAHAFETVHAVVLDARALSQLRSEVNEVPGPVGGAPLLIQRYMLVHGADGELRLAVRTCSCGRPRLGRNPRMRVLLRAFGVDGSELCAAAASGPGGEGQLWETKARARDPQLLRRIQHELADYCREHVTAFLRGEPVPRTLGEPFANVSELMQIGRTPSEHAQAAQQQQPPQQQQHRPSQVLQVLAERAAAGGQPPVPPALPLPAAANVNDPYGYMFFDGPEQLLPHGDAPEDDQHQHEGEEQVALLPPVSRVASPLHMRDADNADGNAGSGDVFFTGVREYADVVRAGGAAGSVAGAAGLGAETAGADSDVELPGLPQSLSDGLDGWSPEDGWLGFFGAAAPHEAVAHWNAGNDGGEQLDEDAESGPRPAFEQPTASSAATGGAAAGLDARSSALDPLDGSFALSYDKDVHNWLLEQTDGTAGSAAAGSAAGSAAGAAESSGYVCCGLHTGTPRSQQCCSNALPEPPQLALGERRTAPKRPRTDDAAEAGPAPKKRF